LSIKIHATVDALGNSTGLHLTTGQACDLESADQLLTVIATDTVIVITNKEYDADTRDRTMKQAGKTAVIAPKRNREELRRYDRHLCKARYLIENFFCTLKQFRAIATRYDKTARNFLAAVQLTAAIIWLN
jgi:transposase